MGKIKTYEVKMSLTGRLTQLPDSQKIFGALIYMYAEQYCSDKATALVRKIKGEELYLTLSNMLPLDYLPVPQTLLLDQLAAAQESSKQAYKAIKERAYAKKEQIDELICNPANAGSVYPYVSLKSSQQIHAAIDSIRYNIPGLDPNLYSVPEVTVVETDKGDNEDHNKGIITKFCFYLSVEESTECSELYEALECAKQQERRFVLGARASQGLNTFVIHNISELPVTEEKTSTYLNLGMLLPRDIDLNQSYLKLFTSERRPYQSPEGWDKGKLNGNFISFIEAGSIVYLTNGREQAGCSIESPFNPRDIVFGNAYVVPINCDRRQQHAHP